MLIELRYTDLLVLRQKIKLEDFIFNKETIMRVGAAVNPKERKNPNLKRVDSKVSSFLTVFKA
jgi:hypothetical protein